MTLTYAGVPLLLEDPDLEARRFVRKYLDERITSIFSERPIWMSERRMDSRYNSAKTCGSADNRVGLPVPNYPLPPTPRINTLYWPTGASRYAHGLFLVNGTNLSTIQAAVGYSNTPQPFVMGAQEMAVGQNVITPTAVTIPRMYMLPPRPVTAPISDTNSMLWIVPLVDERYFWQYRYVSVGSGGRVPTGGFAPTTWPAAFNQILTNIGWSSYYASASPASAYGIPDPVEWRRDGENGAMLLDAACQTVGMRFVFGWNNIFNGYQAQVVNAADALSDYAANIANITSGVWQIVAGGDFSSSNLGAVLPGNVLVVFRSDEGHNVGGYIAIANTGSAADPNSAKTFYCTTPFSSTATRSIAAQVASDFFAWRQKWYDISLAGIVPWNLTGFDDSVTWEFGVIKRGEYCATTRVQTMPYNFGAANLPLQPVGSGSSSSSGSSSGVPAGCIQVVTDVRCSGGDLVPTYSYARACCD